MKRSKREGKSQDSRAGIGWMERWQAGWLERDGIREMGASIRMDVPKWLIVNGFRRLFGMRSKQVSDYLCLS